MIEFHPITAEDARWAVPVMQKNSYLHCGFSFITQYMWSPFFNTHIAKFKDWVVIRSEVKGEFFYLWPVGEGPLKEAIDACIEDAKAHGKKMKLFSISQENKDILEELYPGEFEITCNRDDADYIYEQADLAGLAGRRFQKKRNHVSRFIRENPDWQFHLLKKEDLPKIREFNDAWSQLDGNAENKGIQDEHACIEMLFENFDKLDLRGGYITAGGRIVAYSMGSVINSRVFDTNVEKGLYNVTGSYNIINREMAAHVCADFELINREDDVGDEGLRTAKLSYNPAIIEPKYLASKKAEC